MPRLSDHRGQGNQDTQQPKDASGRNGRPRKETRSTIPGANDTRTQNETNMVVMKIAGKTLVAFRLWFPWRRSGAGNPEARGASPKAKWATRIPVQIMETKAMTRAVMVAVIKDGPIAHPLNLNQDGPRVTRESKSPTRRSF